MTLSDMIGQQDVVVAVLVVLGVLLLDAAIVGAWLWRAARRDPDEIEDR
jgi:hypothetical protein